MFSQPPILNSGYPSWSRLIGSSTTITIPQSGWYLLCLMGAGGSGGVSPKLYSAQGGAGGGYVEDLVFLAVGTTLTVTIGAGGVAAANFSVSGAVGNPGGTSSITGLGLSLVATGGAAGAISSGAAIPKNNGGIGYGGKFTAKGGSGGPLSANTGFHKASGGGAAGTPYGDGGTAAYLNTDNICAGGGAAIGGIVSTAHTGTGSLGGDGTGGSHVGTAGGVNALGFATTHSADGFNRVILSTTSANLYPGSIELLLNPFYSLTGGGTGVDNASTVAAYAGPGAGGGAMTTPTGRSGSGGFGGGGGGGVFSGVNTSSFGNGGRGAGGGGVAKDTSLSHTSGAGGAGFAVIQRVN